MSTSFVRPGHLHAADKILSCSSESGLVVAPATPASGNRGKLRLRTSGTPTAAATLDVQLQTGGNPSGYALTTGSGQGLGAAVIYKKTSDSGAPGTLHWRGYVDTPYVTRVTYPVAYGTGVGKPSTPRTLATGDLGFVTHYCPGTASKVKFTSVTTAMVATTVDVGSLTLSDSGQSDFVVLPDGRLVIIVPYATGLIRYESTDNGATWSSSTAVGALVANQNTVALECVDDMLVMVVSSSTALAATEVRVSQDEGYNWTTVDDTAVLRGARTCVTSTGSILAIEAATGGAAPPVYTIAPGGGLSTSSVDTAMTCYTGRAAIARRDDGTIWAFCTNSTALNHLDIDAAVSLDGGATWDTPLASGRKVLNGNSTNTNAGWYGISAGSWAGRIVLLALSISSGAGASDYALHMYTLGGWESVTEGTLGGVVYTYDHVLVPVDYPDNFGTPWTRVNTGAGATVTNQGPHRFVSTGANASYFQAPTAVLAASGAGNRYRLRYRACQVSGGTLVSASNGFYFAVSDGAGNKQGFALRMSTTQFQIVEADNTTVISTKTLDMTKPTDFFFAFKHDNVANTSGLLSYWYKQDTDETWTLGTAAAAVGEHVIAGNSTLRVGGSSAVVGTHDFYWIGIADDSSNLQGGFTNPTDLVGRSLGTLADFYLYNGIQLGGRNAAGVAGDDYVVGTTYSFGKENLWRELRPSKKVRSAADGIDWNTVFDAGATDTFHGDLVAVFGTNFRTATMEFSNTNSPFAPTASVTLDATLATFTVGAGVRGPGYVGPTTTAGWRQGQFKSDGDAHRFFLEVSGAVYEITDNDENRIYIAGVDLSAAAGTARIFGDRMGAPTAFKQYRYMRLYVSAQETATGAYEAGTPIFDRAFTPIQTYDHGFVDRIEPNVTVFESDSGYRSSARLGPRRDTLAIQWPPIAVTGPAADLEFRLRDFYRSVEGSHRPFVFWQNTSDVSTLRLVTYRGTYQAPNVWGELSDALTRVDQLIVEDYH